MFQQVKVHLDLSLCEFQWYYYNKFMKNADVDLLFLDIEFPEGEDGFEIAQQLMNSRNQCKICFLTSHTELARLGYRVNAFRYIDKKHLEEINEALDFFLKTKIQDRIVYCNNTTGIHIKINLNELLLVETYGRTLYSIHHDTFQLSQ